MIDDTSKIFLDQLYKIGALKFGNFTLASGAESNFYIDLRFLPSFPSVFSNLINQMDSYAKSITDFDAIIGIPLAGIPFGTALSLSSNKPLHLLRKIPKDHGMKKLIEGPSIQGKKILLVDDLISSGHSKEFAIEAIRNEGGVVSDILVLINRTGQSIAEWEHKWDISIHALYDVSASILDSYRTTLNL
ncbi:MAG: orotate phosphoribosyltransferase [Candidatus Heimdallarchaeota archaeon]|nr:orotate phosphoribosyltransferase [Candidatus Heimdallarchaeota archaeon]